MPDYLAFTPADWARLAADWQAWWDGTLARPLVVFELHHTPTGSAHLTRWPLETSPETILDDEERWLRETVGYGDAYPKWWPNFGAGVLAACLGSRVEWRTDTTWFHPLPGDALAEITTGLDPANVWWRRIQALTAAAVARFGDRVVVAHTDLGGTLDVLASLRGTNRLLTDLYDAPDEVTRLARGINATWLACYDALHALIAPAGRGSTAWASPWSPGGRTYMLQCDFAYMISPRMFRRFVLPDLAACCDALDHAFYHLDGKGQIAHVEALLSLERLRGIQWIPGDGAPGPAEWLELLGRIRAGGKLVQLYTTRAEALTIARALGGRGFLFHVTEDGPLDPAAIHAFLETIYNL